jgi:hypothetical protein
MIEEAKIAEQERLSSLNNSTSANDSVTALPSLESLNVTVEGDYIERGYVLCSDTDSVAVGPTSCSRYFYFLRFFNQVGAQTEPQGGGDGTLSEGSYGGNSSHPTKDIIVPQTITDAPSDSASPIIMTPPKPPPTAQPTQDESVFKSIMKRLQDLEENARSSSEYLNQQTELINKAFMDLEKSQVDKINGIFFRINLTTAKHHETLVRLLLPETISLTPFRDKDTTPPSGFSCRAFKDTATSWILK